MEGVLRYSTLNPLARSFVPLNIKIVFQGSKSCIADHDNVESKRKTLKLSSGVEIRIKKSRRIPKRIDIFMTKSIRCKILDLTQSTIKLLNENHYFTKKLVDSEPSKSIVASEFCRPTLNEIDLLKYLFLTLLGIPLSKKRSDKAIEFTKNETNSRTSPPVEEKCNCPPMFGCIVPPEFFGNPFNLKSSCNKKNIHVCHYSKANENYPAPQTLQNSRFQTKADEISAESCETVSSKNIGYIGKGVGFLKCSEENYTTCEKSTSDPFLNTDLIACERSPDDKQDSLNLLTVKETSFESKISKDGLLFIDDDFHPLLDEGICMEADKDTFNEMDELETKLFAESPPLRISSDPEELADTVVCNPPCSVWCNSVPQTAKEAYRKYIKSLPRSLGNPRRFTKKGLTENFSSALDYCVYSERSHLEKKKNVLNGMDSSRLRPSIARQRILQQYSTDGQKFAPRVNAPATIRDSGRCNASMWRIVDGKDSLWQAMPDCSPTSNSRF